MSPKKKPLGGMREAFGNALRSQPMEKVKFKWKRSLLLIAIGVVAYVVLRLILELGGSYSFAVWFVYEGVAAATVIAYVITVRGNLSSKPITHDMLPAEWDDGQKKKYIELDAERRKKGKIFLYIAFPFILAVMMAMLTEIWWPLVTGRG